MIHFIHILSLKHCCNNILSTIDICQLSFTVQTFDQKQRYKLLLKQALFFSINSIPKTLSARVSPSPSYEFLTSTFFLISTINSTSKYHIQQSQLNHCPTVHPQPSAITRIPNLKIFPPETSPSFQLTPLERL